MRKGLVYLYQETMNLDQETMSPVFAGEQVCQVTDRIWCPQARSKWRLRRLPPIGKIVRTLKGTKMAKVTKTGDKNLPLQPIADFLGALLERSKHFDGAKCSDAAI